MLRDQGKLSDMEYQVYELLCTQQGDDAVRLSAVIYLEASPATSLRRVTSRGRSGEEHLSYEYIASCSEYHERWVCEQEQGRRVAVLRINVDEDTSYDQGSPGMKWIQQMESFLRSLVVP